MKRTLSPRSGSQAERTARRLSDHPWLERLARAGYAGSGLVHLVLGWIALRVALGSSGESADQSGALEAVREAPLGALLLWFCVVGFVALAVFQLLEAAVGGGELTDRAKALGKAVLYGVLGATSFSVARGTGADSEESTSEITQTLMSAPAGQLLVGIVGLAILATGGYHVYKGVTKKFCEDLVTTGPGEVGRGVMVAGVVGYTAKGVALGVVGVLFALAAWRRDPGEARGLDGALKALAEQPLGTVLLLVVALGLMLYGVYSFARARYARL